jgi:hypothetical protein
MLRSVFKTSCGGFHNPLHIFSQAYETRCQYQLGSSKRDRRVTIKFKDEEILVERVGTDGDVAKARQMYLDLDGKVDAFGVGVPAPR